MHKELLEDIGEKELIKRLSRFMPRDQASDDCGYLQTNKKNLIINNDVLVENVHFNKSTISAKDIGWKAVVSNISDLLSSGSKETIGITVGLILPAKTEWIWVEELYRGINQALKRYGGIIIGGDCSLGNEKVISITALGKQGELEMRRNACQPGDVILTTGVHGLSKLGLILKTENYFDDEIVLSEKLIKMSKQQFCRPKLKQNFSKKLLKTRSQNKINRIGCTDSSDGLFQAILDLSTASNCKAIIDYEKIPKLKGWPNGSKWDELYFFGGEDYQLIFALPKQWANNLLKIDKKVTEIGLFTNGNASVEIKNLKNNKLLNSKAFKHF